MKKVFNVFKQTKQRTFKKRFFGFDIETYNDNKSFLLASIVGYNRYGKPYEKTFHSKEEFIKEIKTNRIFKNSYIFATNLGFDFFGMFFNTEDVKYFQTVFRGSSLLFAKTYFSGEEFSSSSKKSYKSGKRKSSVTFVDSLNYAKMSVAQMGKIIGMPKLESPVFGNYPKDDAEMQYMIKYNLRDSWVTYNFMKFFIDSIEELGATFKLTIASTSMSLFKNKYLGDRIVYPSRPEVYRLLFDGYYGGRTEAFSRGYFENYNYYDFNSLYPSIMESELFPDPNSQRINREDKIDYIENYEGVSKVTIEVQHSHKPLLPHREDGKLLFADGIFTGSWTHLELREAIDDGAVIKKVFHSIYYTKTCRPFKEFVTTLYNLRNKYKKDKNPMQLVTKLFMNSLYGKFGEKFDNKGNTIHKSCVTKTMLDNAIDVQPVGEDYLRITENQIPKAHCIPIWAIYVSAYGRVKLTKEMRKHNAIYCDTDSLITKDTLPTSNKLGELKLEMHIKRGLIVRPKFYGLEPSDGKWETKIKGLPLQLAFGRFKQLKFDPTIKYSKFAKFNESVRRNLIPNQIIDTSKTFNLEDTKRDWRGKTISFSTLQGSDPLYIDANLNVNSNPIISNGARSRGDVAPIIKYDSINITEPNTPTIEEV